MFGKRMFPLRTLEGALAERVAPFLVRGRAGRKSAGSLVAESL